MPRKMGRPTKYRPEMCEQIVEHMASGLSKFASAAKMGVNMDTLYEWARVHPEFSVAIKQGEQESILFWESLGIKGAAGEQEGFNATAWIFNMKNRLHWVDKSEKAVTHSGGTDNKITIELVDAHPGNQEV